MYQGSCLCGKVTFEIRAGIEDIICCHCAICRKAQGSAFATNGNVNAKDFRFTAGEHLLSNYESSPGKIRYFCSHCGSPMLSKGSASPDKVRVRLGTLDSDVLERPKAHIFVASKANWESLQIDLPQYDSYEPGR